VAAGLRAALAVVAPLVVGLAINHLLQGLAIAIGALIMGAVSLRGGPYRAGRHATAGLRRRVRSPRLSATSLAPASGGHDHVYIALRYIGTAFATMIL